MTPEEIKYFGDIIRLKTPRQFPGQYDEVYTEMCSIYCLIRNTARDVFLPPKLNPKNAREKIEGLLEKVKNLSLERAGGCFE